MVPALGEWLACRATEAGGGGAALSSRGTAPVPGTPTAQGWLPAQLPETALALLLRSGQMQRQCGDPAKGFNLATIPDIYHGTGRDYYTFWWCTRFATPEAACNDSPPRQQRRVCSLFPPLPWVAGAGKGESASASEVGGADPTPYVQLLLGGANYSVDVFVNGAKLVGEGCAEDGVGMALRRAAVDVTGVLARGAGSLNYVAVKVSPPDHVGCVDKGGQGGDHMIAKDVTSQFVEGWDWVNPVPDRNTVRLTITTTEKRNETKRNETKRNEGWLTHHRRMAFLRLPFLVVFASRRPLLLLLFGW